MFLGSLAKSAPKARNWNCKGKLDTFLKVWGGGWGYEGGLRREMAGRKTTSAFQGLSVLMLKMGKITSPWYIGILKFLDLFSAVFECLGNGAVRDRWHHSTYYYS